ncbi:putative E3 ubiquitin-protein ligase HTD2 [Modicella reniformis]|uniref:E3 ubiquitin-protein ligase HTD2 n=1 Tax=Modicella reniformis TaxID=1440133 RepID=A0A9P6IR47_9FUNG|nr:putative E3 ubiquitin-protein ligase HTD2 [Modicella reniformis]
MSAKEIRIRFIEYELVRILVELTLYNGVILGVRFLSVVYRKLLGWKIGLDSFIESFLALCRGLEQMLTWTDVDVYEYLEQITLPLIPSRELISVTTMSLQRPEELKLFLCGNSDLDMRDLEANCLYGDGYSPDSRVLGDCA